MWSREVATWCPTSTRATSSWYHIQLNEGENSYTFRRSAPERLSVVDAVVLRPAEILFIHLVAYERLAHMYE